MSAKINRGTTEIIIAIYVVGSILATDAYGTFFLLGIGILYGITHWRQNSKNRTPD